MRFWLPFGLALFAVVNASTLISRSAIALESNNESVAEIETPSSTEIIDERFTENETPIGLTDVEEANVDETHSNAADRKTRSFGFGYGIGYRKPWGYGGGYGYRPYGYYRPYFYQPYHYYRPYRPYGYYRRPHYGYRYWG